MKRGAISLVVVLAFAASAPAVSWGPRVGLSSDPDQIIGGVHFDAGYLAKDVRIRPSVQVGLGDDVFTLAGAGAVHYEFGDVGGDWRPYVGGELAFIYYNFDVPNIPGVNIDDDDTELGLSAAGGIEKTLSSGSVLQLELRIGIIDETPDLQFHVGWAFGGRRSSSTAPR